MELIQIYLTIYKIDITPALLNCLQNYRNDLIRIKKQKGHIFNQFALFYLVPI